jgi:hypothetical protein
LRGVFFRTLHVAEARTKFVHVNGIPDVEAFSDLSARE